MRKVSEHILFVAIYVCIRMANETRPEIPAVADIQVAHQAHCNATHWPAYNFPLQQFGWSITSATCSIAPCVEMQASSHQLANKYHQALLQGIEMQANGQSTFHTGELATRWGLPIHSYPAGQGHAQLLTSPEVCLASAAICTQKSEA